MNHPALSYRPFSSSQDTRATRIPSSGASAGIGQTKVEKLVFSRECDRELYDNKQRRRGWDCQFSYLGTDANGRDLYEVVREKI